MKNTHQSNDPWYEVESNVDDVSYLSCFSINVNCLDYTLKFCLHFLSLSPTTAAWKQNKHKRMKICVCIHKEKFLLRLKEKQLEIHCLKHFDPFLLMLSFIFFFFFLFNAGKHFIHFPIHEWQSKQECREIFLIYQHRRILSSSYYSFLKFLIFSFKRKKISL